MDAQDIRDLVSRFLRGCGLVYPPMVYDNKLEEDCIADAVRRKYITDEDQTLKRFIPAGVSISSNAYSHQRQDIQIFVAIWTALLVYLDDVGDKDVERIRAFNYRFVTGSRHEDAMLNHLTEMLREMPAMFGRIEADLMVISTMNGLTSLLIEHEIKDVKLEPSSYRFPTFVRGMTGAADADILSFYKEQLSGDTVNRVSLISQCRGISPGDALNELVDEGINAHQRVLSILSSDEKALAAYKSFAQGFVGFHTNLSRYRLHELGLGDRN
ncbi:isoprenoid synthase domain-containing protein [Xylariaceae sp. FL0594]|nr:isoprenoid synthase domain-containing protein [Xylariaceae sp. FL0594]